MVPKRHKPPCDTPSVSLRKHWARRLRGRSKIAARSSANAACLTGNCTLNSCLHVRSRHMDACLHSRTSDPNVNISNRRGLLVVFRCIHRLILTQKRRARTQHGWKNPFSPMSRERRLSQLRRSKPNQTKYSRAAHC